MQRVLVISAHPDDETLGCGGTLLQHRGAGDEVNWIIATRAHAPRWSPDVIEQKDAEIRRVAQAYCIQETIALGLPAARLDVVAAEDVMKPIAEAAARIRPQLVYLVHGGDVHGDHRALHAAAMSVFKPFHMSRLGVQRILCYETLSSTDAAAPGLAAPFIPNVFIDIGPHLARKIEIMKLFTSELQADPLPRGPSAITALARLRGSTIGVEYAEAFMLVREIQSASPGTQYARP